MVLFYTVANIDNIMEVWWGALSAEGRKLDRCSKVIIGFPVSIPSALVKR